jgi:hypothetical protein
VSDDCADLGIRDLPLSSDPFAATLVSAFIVSHPHRACGISDKPTRDGKRQRGCAGEPPCSPYSIPCMSGARQPAARCAQPPPPAPGCFAAAEPPSRPLRPCRLCSRQGPPSCPPRSQSTARSPAWTSCLSTAGARPTKCGRWSERAGRAGARWVPGYWDAKAGWLPLA